MAVLNERVKILVLLPLPPPVLLSYPSYLYSKGRNFRPRNLVYDSCIIERIVVVTNNSINMNSVIVDKGLLSSLCANIKIISPNTNSIMFIMQIAVIIIFLFVLLS